MHYFESKYIDVVAKQYLRSSKLNNFNTAFCIVFEIGVDRPYKLSTKVLDRNSFLSNILSIFDWFIFVTNPPKTLLKGRVQKERKKVGFSEGSISNKKKIKKNVALK